MHIPEKTTSSAPQSSSTKPRRVCRRVDHPNAFRMTTEKKSATSRASHILKLVLVFVCLLPTCTLALGGISELFPPGVDQAKFAKMIPIFTGGLTSCGGPNALLTAFNLFSNEKDFMARYVFVAYRHKTCMCVCV